MTLDTSKYINIAPPMIGIRELRLSDGAGFMGLICGAIRNALKLLRVNSVPISPSDSTVQSDALHQETRL